MCVSAEQNIADALDPRRYDLEVVHLGEQAGRIPEAESKGVQSAPALVLGDQTFHINFGASLDDLKDGRAGGSRRGAVTDSAAAS